MNDKKKLVKNAGLEKARQKTREMREAGLDVERKNPMIKAKEDPTSLRKAINGFCYNCMGGLIDGSCDPNWRKDITNCTSWDCSLRPVRPFQKKTSDN